jgi:hypothetical protein
MVAVEALSVIVPVADPLINENVFDGDYSKTISGVVNVMASLVPDITCNDPSYNEVEVNDEPDKLEIDT